MAKRGKKREKREALKPKTMVNRGKKRKEVVEETDGDGGHLQDNAAARSENCRVTRRTSAILKQCASSTTPVICPLQYRRKTSNQCSISARRVLLKDNDTTCAESQDIKALQTQTSKLPHQNEVHVVKLPTSPVASLNYSAQHAGSDGSLHAAERDEIMKSAGNSILPESENWFAPISNNVLDVQNFTSKLLAQHAGSDGSPHAAERDAIMKSAGNSILPESENWFAPISNTVPDVQNFTSKLLAQTSLQNWSAPISQNMLDAENFTSNLLSQTEKSQELQLTVLPIALDEKLSPNKLPVIEANVELNAITPIPENFAPIHTDKHIHPSKSTSFNITEMVQLCNAGSLDDEEEVESPYNPALVTVNGYRVKQEVAPLLREIFAKHSGIAKDSFLESSQTLAPFLEIICYTYQNLKMTNFTDVTPVELDSMLCVIRDLERMKLNVGWLREKLVEIKEAKELLRGYFSLKKEKARNLELIERKEKELETHEVRLAAFQQKVILLKHELTTMKTKDEQITTKFRETKEKADSFYGKSLVDGLL